MNFLLKNVQDLQNLNKCKKWIFIFSLVFNIPLYCPNLSSAHGGHLGKGSKWPQKWIRTPVLDSACLKTYKCKPYLQKLKPCTQYLVFSDFSLKLLSVPIFTNLGALIRKTVIFRAMVLLRLLIYIIKLTINNCQNHSMRILIFFFFK